MIIAIAIAIALIIDTNDDHSYSEHPLMSQPYFISIFVPGFLLIWFHKLGFHDNALMGRVPHWQMAGVNRRHHHHIHHHMIIILFIPSLKSTTMPTATGALRQNSFVGL